MYLYDDEYKPKQIEVNVSLTLTKTLTIDVYDYDVKDEGVDEDGSYYEDIDYSVCDLNSAVKDQIILPNEAWKYFDDKTTEKIIDDLKDWTVEELYVEEA